MLVEKNVQPLRFLTRKRVQILESNRNSLFDEETVQQLRLPIGKSFQRKESNQNSVLDFEFSCYFEPMVNVKRHGSNEEYYNFDQEENKNQENIKRTDHDPKGMKNVRQLNVTTIYSPVRDIAKHDKSL